MAQHKEHLFGKGLELEVILRIFGYASVSMVVLALPLAVLLASLFTMGNFGEQYELAAMRASGRPIRWILRPMILATICIAGLSFYMSSYVVPVTNLKLYSLIYDIKQLKPTFSLEPGYFNSDIDQYVIRIGAKDLDKEMLYDVMIYDHTEGMGNDKLVVADSAIMKVDPYGTFMNMWLFSGASYETVYEDKGRPTETESFVRIQFNALYYNFDISGFSLERTAEEDFASHHYMLNLSDLDYSMDTVLIAEDSVMQEFRNYMVDNAHMDTALWTVKDTVPEIKEGSILQMFPKFKRREIMQRARTNSESLQRASKVTEERFQVKEERFRNYLLEFHGKFSLPMACIIFLFIGAPLGAVVRKGGVGIPILISIVFYLLFYVLMIQGKKMATEGVVSVWFGSWLPIMILTPLAVFFTYQASSMRRLQFGLVMHAFRNGLQDLLVFLLRPIFRLFAKKKVEEAPVSTLSSMTILPEDLEMPDYTVNAEEEMDRWQRELGLEPSEEVIAETEAELAEMEPEDLAELERWELELGISMSNGMLDL